MKDFTEEEKKEIDEAIEALNDFSRYYLTLPQIDDKFLELATKALKVSETLAKFDLSADEIHELSLKAAKKGAK